MLKPAIMTKVSTGVTQGKRSEKNVAVIMCASAKGISHPMVYNLASELQMITMKFLQRGVVKYIFFSMTNKYNILFAIFHNVVQQLETFR